MDSERHWSEIGDKEFWPRYIPAWSREDGEKMMGYGLESGYQYLVKKHGLAIPFERYESELTDLVGVIYSTHAQLMPGARSAVERLRSLNVPLGIASASKRIWIDTALRRLNLGESFSVIASADDVAPRTKPHPDVYLFAAKRLKANPVDCVAIEDSAHGIAAAKAAGMTCIALKSGTNEQQDLSQADHVIHHHDDLTMELFRTL